MIILRYGLDVEGVPYTPLGELREYGKILTMIELGENLDCERRKIPHRLKVI